MALLCGTRATPWTGTAKAAGSNATVVAVVAAADIDSGVGVDDDFGCGFGNDAVRGKAPAGTLARAVAGPAQLWRLRCRLIKRKRVFRRS